MTALERMDRFEAALREQPRYFVGWMLASNTVLVAIVGVVVSVLSSGG